MCGLRVHIHTCRNMEKNAIHPNIANNKEYDALFSFIISWSISANTCIEREKKTRTPALENTWNWPKMRNLSLNLQQWSWREWRRTLAALLHWSLQQCSRPAWMATRSCWGASAWRKALGGWFQPAFNQWFIIKVSQRDKSSAEDKSFSFLLLQ